MTIQARRELLSSVRDQYQCATWTEKRWILDGFVVATGYGRKHAISLLARPDITEVRAVAVIERQRKYDAPVKQALITLWYAADQICSKRLAPFLPELVESMERHGHLSLPKEVRERVLQMGHSTIDRLLKTERRVAGRKSIGATTAGNLLKRQIPVRTFADWNEDCPGFFEVDLVAHCGGDVSGSFLNTLVLTDIATGWTECVPLLQKSAANVITGIELVTDLLPFKLLGIDTDNGSEFINHDLVDYCAKHEITFTRSRAYKKNDQAHVESKNGSIVRRVVGYERFEGYAAWQALTQLYAVLRHYVNFFQPSLKLLSKSRSGATVTKRYDSAKTPSKRVQASPAVAAQNKGMLIKQTRRMDPVDLLNSVQRAQDRLWAHAWQRPIEGEMTDIKRLLESCAGDQPDRPKQRHFRSAGSKPDKRSAPRTWKTRKDPFDGVIVEIELYLQLDPLRTAKNILERLMGQHPGRFSKSQLRTLQRRVECWRKQQKGHEEELRKLMSRPLMEVL